MLRAYLLERGRNCKDLLPLIEFACKNYHSSIGMAMYESFYRRICRSHLCWTEVGDKNIIGPKIIQETTKKINMIQEKRKKAQDHQKSYAGHRRIHLEFREGNHVF